MSLQPAADPADRLRALRLARSSKHALSSCVPARVPRIFARAKHRVVSSQGCLAVRLKSLLPLLLLLADPLVATAQQTISIDNWRFQTGDNTAWAAPAFDDSSWTPTSFPVVIFNEPNSEGFHWYRATFQIPDNLRNQDLALGMAAMDDVYEIYINGVSIGRFGQFEPTPEASYPKHFVFRIPSTLLQDATAHIALRRFRGPFMVRLQMFYTGGTFNFNHPPRLGTFAAIDAQEKLDMANGAIQMMPADLTAVLFLFAAGIAFVLYSTQRRRKEYLYLFLYCICSGIPPFIAIYTTTNPAIASRSWGPVLLLLFGLACPGISFLFLAALTQRFRRILLAGAVFDFLIAFIAAYWMVTDSGYELAIIYIFTFLAPFIQLVAVVGLLFDRDKGSLIIALFLLLSSTSTVWFNMRVLLHHSPIVFLGPFLIDTRNLFSALLIFAILVILYFRYRDEQARQEAIDKGLAAARRMQQQLLATTVGSHVGFDVTAVYRPAQEVGGDFYSTQLLEDGSLLVVVGDVSGKGLDAAMLVAAVLGGLAIEKEFRPSALLEDLNKAVLGRTGGGFITACCARFFPDGRVTLSNAGHISPCINGREIEVPGGIPLGIVPHVQYAETTVHLNGSTITFLSDGVAEARDTKGELLGFERMAALSLQPAANIADAAQRWGQEDDITILTVALAATAI